MDLSPGYILRSDGEDETAPGTGSSFGPASSGLNCRRLSSLKESVGRDKPGEKKEIRCSHDFDEQVAVAEPTHPTGPERPRPCGSCVCIVTIALGVSLLLNFYCFWRINLAELNEAQGFFSKWNLEKGNMALEKRNAALMKCCQSRDQAQFWDVLDRSLARFKQPRRGELIVLLQNVLQSLNGAGQGGQQTISDEDLQTILAQPGMYDVKDHLQGFTGLSDAELHRRLARSQKTLHILLKYNIPKRVPASQLSNIF